jgi:hypothetical protein
MCRLRRVGVSLLVAFVVASSVTAPAGATDHEAPVPGAAQLGDAGIEPDGVLLRADVRANGDARWTVEYRVRLNDENTTAAFESLREDIEANESAYTSRFADRMRATARAAENTTGREMRVENVSVSATRQQLPQEYGVVTYQFDWRAFAVADGQTLRAGDALAGLFLDRQTTLVLSWPDAYATTAIQPSPDERRENAAVWVGPADFGDGEPAVSLSTAATETGGVGGSGGDGADDGVGRDRTGGGSSLLPVVGGAVLLAVAAGAVVLWRRSRRDEHAVGGTDAEAPRAGDDVSDAAATTTATATAAADTDGAEDTDTEEADVATANESPDPWEDELLSNEERVLALLEHNDGRMKQQAVAAELDWSDAKTSQVVGKLRDADEIETFRIGRENVVSLPGSGLS